MVHITSQHWLRSHDHGEGGLSPPPVSIALWVGHYPQAAQYFASRPVDEVAEALLQDMQARITGPAWTFGGVRVMNCK